MKLRESKINDLNTPEQFINDLEIKVNDFINRYIKIKDEKINLIINYYQEINNAMNYATNELSEKKYYDIANSLINNIKSLDRPNMQMASQNIILNKEKIKIFLNEAKTSKANIDNEEK
ncbi:hypothetical protein [Metamycoplasma neophronis]|uniref:Uncharacterized protein n=1 Tax=Metamycoplasma neophronis TaxID=872983 RepID=A0ABY2Z4N8_9BACT|nr:hypothetical protein [Metamycoplasma neophronis]TPR53533.1 hypothetical protein FJR74_02440 [Metamycoplasma neophronis]